MKHCKNCQKTFTVSAKAADLCTRMQVPEPNTCPDCIRFQHFVQINQLNLFKRNCDATGKTIISHYPADSEHTVFDLEYWHSDAFDGTEYGRDYDFNRPFFEQWQELNFAVPKLPLLRDTRDENSDYTSYAGKNKDCYFIFDSDENRDCLYSYGMNHSSSSLDCYRVQNMELCYEAVDCNDCYNCAYIQNSSNCIDSMFLFACSGVKNSLFCVNLRQKEYHVFNKPVSKKEFDDIKNSLKDRAVLADYKKKFDTFAKQFPRKFFRGVQNENSTGNHLVQCKDAQECFDSMKVWNAEHCSQVFIGAKDIAFCDEVGDTELAYCSNNCGFSGYNIRFSLLSLYQPQNLTYSKYCFNGCSDLFGCISLKRKKYCILNKQYSKEEYEALVPRIIEHMKSTGEWGEFFPAWTSDFAYNLSVAQERYPLSKEQVLAYGLRWRDEDERDYQPASQALPQHVSEIEDGLAQAIFSCEQCSKNFKFTALELKLHQQIGVPLQGLCFHCRHDKRFKSRTPQYLWDRQCDACSTDIRTAYAPGSEEKVYCEACYLKEVY